MMRLISSEFFARSPVLIFPVLALGLFFVVFVLISLRALLTQRDEMDAAARLPLNDGDSHHG
jgi:cbb3-type cytochrome oxidase subunit 3